MLRIENLQYIIKKGKLPVFEIFIKKLEITSGEVVGILGENGSGKTTFLDIISGNKRPLKGLVEFTNKNHSLSMVFQDSSFDDFPIEEILSFFGKANNNKQDFSGLLSTFGLWDSKSKRFSELSFGQKQLFRFIIALLKPFSILVLDEVMAGIDFSWKQKIKAEIKNIIKTGCTIIFVSHDIEEIAFFCRRVLLLENGSLTDDFPLVGNFAKRKEILFSKIPFLEKTNEEEGD